jgi:hypothetical protein
VINQTGRRVKEERSTPVKVQRDECCDWKPVEPRKAIDKIR